MTMPCGHPEQCVVSSDEGTSYCGWCKEVARLREAVELAYVKIVMNDGDVLVLRVPGRLRTAARESLRRSWQIFFPGKTCVILEDGLSVEVIGKDDANKNRENAACSS